MMIPNEGGHVSEEDMLRHVDAQDDERARAHIRAHLQECAVCTREVARLRSLSTTIHRRLAKLDSTPPEALLPRSFRQLRAGSTKSRAPAPRRPRLAWSVAAAVFLIALVSVVASPLRAWLADQVGGSRIGLALPAETVPPARPTQESSRPEGELLPGLEFEPESAELRIEFLTSQEQGELLVRTAGKYVQLEVLNPHPAHESMLLLPSGIQVRNARGSVASYRLTLPAKVQTVRIRIGERPPLILSSASLGPGEDRSIPLHRAP